MPERPDDLVVLTSAASEIQASLYASILTSNGIDAIGPNAAATTLRWEVSSTDPYRVYVRREDFDRAKAVLARERADSVDLDWDEIDVGEGEEGTLPAPDPERRVSIPWGWLIVLLLVAGFIAARITMSESRRVP